MEKNELFLQTLFIELLNLRCNDMQSQAVLQLIAKSGNRLRLHLSRNPAASSHPRLSSPT
jgi:hypothetical protein